MIQDLTEGWTELDLTLQSPRLLTPDTSPEVRLEISKSSALGPYKGALRHLAQNQVAEMHAEIEAISIQNRLIEQTEQFKACNGIGYPKYRKPLSVHDFFESFYGKGCWQDEAFEEDFLKHHPGLRINVRRGTHGQEYVNGA